MNHRPRQTVSITNTVSHPFGRRDGLFTRIRRMARLLTPTGLRDDADEHDTGRVPLPDLRLRVGAEPDAPRMVRKDEEPV
jgi:hypothetical protein